MKVIDKQFAICVDNEGYEASLIAGKVYRLIPDKTAAEQDMLRLVDESGEDYLFHKRHFALVDFPPSVLRQIQQVKSLR